MGADELAHLAGRLGSCLDRGAHAADVTLHQRGDKTPADLHASTAGAPILTVVTILAAIIVLICIVAGAYALFPVNGTALH